MTRNFFDEYIKIVDNEEVEPIKLDLTTFDVKTDTINNVYDGMLSNKFFGIKYVKDIEVNHLDKLLNDNKYSILTEQCLPLRLFGFS